MKIFVSWSGPRAEALGTFLRVWVGDVIQAVDPWVSSEDLRKGQPWFPGIGDQLKEMAAAIVVITPENMHEDWLLFEAGAAFGPGHPCFTYLFDLAPPDIKGPLAGLHHTRAEKDDTLRMVRAINDLLGELGGVALPEKSLDRQFEQWWPELKKKLEEVGEMEVAVPEAPKREANEMIAEILIRSRQHSQELALLKLPPPPFTGGRAGMKGLFSPPEGIPPSSLPGEPPDPGFAAIGRLIKSAKVVQEEAPEGEGPDPGLSPKTLKAIGRMIKSAKVAQEEAPEGEGPTGGKSEDGEAGGNT